ncbi:hypothetical protein [Plastoroseomonas arctica]|uniref:Uncharacterized protein n=1 Tax=Plastoroseomonas arctica TaxID=1509237 RepID=A0AAF1JYL7_9PROT|nr:hypothetical protein [Plastoroseomonas arctica]MBR0653658.1 hypothetical protein [Plastoroseomonas arctica]
MFFSELEEQLAVVTSYAAALSTAYVSLVQTLAKRGVITSAESEELLAIMPPPVPRAVAPLSPEEAAAETLRAVDSI